MCDFREIIWIGGRGVGGQAAWGRGLLLLLSLQPLIPCSLHAASSPGTAAAQLIFPAGDFISGAEILISVAKATQSMSQPSPLLGLQLFAQTISNHQNFMNSAVFFLLLGRGRHALQQLCLCGIAQKVFFSFFIFLFFCAR